MFTEEGALKVINAANHISERIVSIRGEAEKMVKGEEPYQDGADGLKVGDIADIYVMVGRAYETIDEARKLLLKYKEHLSYEVIPEMFERENLKTMNTASGYRVTVSARLSASILDQPRAFAWLRENELGDIIKETVHAGTLSAQLKDMMQQDNIDPPEDLFKISTMPVTSVTKVKK